MARSNPDSEQGWPLIRQLYYIMADSRISSDIGSEGLAFHFFSITWSHASSHPSHLQVKANSRNHSQPARHIFSKIFSNAFLLLCDLFLWRGGVVAYLQSSLSSSKWGLKFSTMRWEGSGALITHSQFWCGGYSKG